MPLQATSGAASYDGFGGGVAAVPNYIEDVFSTWLYSSTGTSPSAIVNGIDLAGKGGLVIGKVRNYVDGMGWVDTVRGGSNFLQSDVTNESFNSSCYSFNNNGYSLQSTNFLNFGTAGQYNFCSWTFRKQPKFFDVVTYTGTGSTRTVPHNLGSVPGCIIIKNLSDTDGWLVYHRSIGATKTLGLNTTGAAVTDGATYFNDTEPTSTVFTVKEGGKANASSNNYVAYVFAHNAGGFGLTGTDNVISCGSYTGNGSTDGPVIDLGYEPQWLLIKSSSASSTAWTLIDNMRGMTVGGADAYLKPNSSDAETTSLDLLSPTATGFKLTSTLGLVNGANDYIYIAIRRGPMKVPTSGTSVYNAILRTGTGSSQTDTGIGFAPDWALIETRSNNADKYTFSRLQGNDVAVLTNTAEPEFNSGLLFNGATGTITNTVLKLVGRTYVDWYFKRSPSVFDIVCYTGNGASSNAKTHNLTVAPELLIIKNRSAQGSGDWFTFHTFTSSNFKKQLLDATDAQTNYTYGSFLDAQPTSTTFTVNSGAGCNASGTTYIAFLFASAAGVSKVGNFTGNGTTQTIDCGFPSGARWVLIKRTDSTGDWYVYDTTRGMTTLTDPYLLLNVTDAETATLGSVTTVSTGFALNSAILAAINVSGGSYIFLAIA